MNQCQDCETLQHRLESIRIEKVALRQALEDIKKHQEEIGTNMTAYSMTWWIAEAALKVTKTN